MLADTQRRVEAARRVEYISDTTTAIAGLFSKSELAKEHIDALIAISEGKDDG